MWVLAVGDGSRRPFLDHLWKQHLHWTIPDHILSPWMDTAAEGLAQATLAAAALSRWRRSSSTLDGPNPSAPKSPAGPRPAFLRLDLAGIDPARHPAGQRPAPMPRAGRGGDPAVAALSAGSERPGPRRRIVGWAILPILLATRYPCGVIALRWRARFSPSWVRGRMMAMPDATTSAAPSSNRGCRAPLQRRTSRSAGRTASRHSRRAR